VYPWEALLQVFVITWLKAWLKASSKFCLGFAQESKTMFVKPPFSSAQTPTTSSFLNMWALYRSVIMPPPPRPQSTTTKEETIPGNLQQRIGPSEQALFTRWAQGWARMRNDAVERKQPRPLGPSFSSFNREKKANGIGTDGEPHMSVLSWGCDSFDHVAIVSAPVGAYPVGTVGAHPVGKSTEQWEHIQTWKVVDAKQLTDKELHELYVTQGSPDKKACKVAWWRW
jgi:hypothetical protein